MDPKNFDDRNFITVDTDFTGKDHVIIPPNSFALALYASAVHVGANYNGLLDPSPLTVTGTGVPFSYAAATAAQKAFLESSVGSSIPLELGSGFSPITITPEPTTLALFGLGLAGLGFARRKRMI